MSALLYIAGLVIGVTVFIYLVSLLNDGKEKIKETTEKIKNNGEEVKDNALPSTEKIAPGERICPLCRSKLSKYEALYAAPVAGDKEQKLMIYGCRYCYKDDENPEEKKKSIL